MKRACCRDMPRCADCPVRLAAAGRRRITGPQTPAAVVEEVLRGRDPRPLPVAVVQALAALDAREPQRTNVT